MKKLHTCIAASVLALLTLGACNDEWKDELYTHMVSLKAPVGDEGVCDVYLRYETDGEVIYDLPVLRSGSTLADNAVDVFIVEDPDTLETFNNEKYQYRTDLYFQQLTTDYYEFLSPSCHIPAGSNKELFQIKFKFKGLDLSQEWVLPLTIKDDPAYVANYRKGWRKALLHVLPFNDYSGNYSASAMNIYFADSNQTPLVVDTRRAYVVDENTVFFYAGTKRDDAIDRQTYKINVKFEEATTVSEDSRSGNLTVTAVNPDIDFRVEGQPTYEIREEMDATQPYLKHQYFTLRMTYYYTDITTSEDNPTEFRAEGSMTMERKINTLIPDQDQAIQW